MKEGNNCTRRLNNAKNLIFERIYETYESLIEKIADFSEEAMQMANGPMKKCGEFLWLSENEPNLYPRGCGFDLWPHSWVRDPALP